MFITGLRSNKLGLSHLLKASRIRLGYSVATLMLGYSSYYLYDHLFDTSVQVYTHTESTEQHLIDVFKQVSYQPTLYLGHRLLQLMYATRIEKPIEVEFERQIYKLPDGGQLALDWMNRNLETDKPLILITHGLTGGSDSNYIKYAAQSLQRNGYQVVCFNQRGVACDLITSKYHCHGITDDFREVINYLHEQNPKQIIYGLGFSIGANLMLKYAGQEGTACKLNRMISIANPYNLLECSYNILKPRNWIYDWSITTNFKRLLTANLTQLSQNQQIEIEGALKARNTYEFDEYVTRRLFDFQSPEELYKFIGCEDYIGNVKVPVVCIHSKDDPIVPMSVIPMQKLLANPNIAVAFTRKGAHVEWFSGSKPKRGIQVGIEGDGIRKYRIMILLLNIIFHGVCLQLGDNSEIDLTYRLLDAHYVQFELTCRTQFWCAIGFGRGYSNSDMIRLLYQDGFLRVQDLMCKPSAKYKTPLVDIHQDVEFISGKTTTTTINAIIQRRIVTDDLTDYAIALYQQIPMFYMLGNTYDLSEYQQYGVFNISLGDISEIGCHYTCTLCYGPFQQQCLRCSDKYLLNGVCTNANDLTYPSSSQNVISNDLIIYWEYVDDYIVMMFHMIQCDWFALGFNNTLMLDSDMLLFEIIKITDVTTSYSIQVHDMQGVKNVVPNDDIILGGHQDWVLLGFDWTSTIVKVKVMRKLKSLDAYDYDFTNKKDIKAMYAYGNTGPLMYHNANRGVFDLMLSQDTAQDVESFLSQLVTRGHTIILFVFWGVLADVGIFFARQLKSYPKYAKVHGTIFLFQGIFTYIFVITMISKQSQKIQELGYQRDLIIVHFINGIFVLVLSTIQIFMGMIVKNNLESVHGSEKIFRVKLLHFYMGYTLYFVTKVQVALGMHIYQTNMLFWFYAYYLLLVLIKIAIELLYHFEVSLIPRKRIKYSYVEVDQNHLYESIVDKLNTQTPYCEMMEDYPRITYILLREAVYDVSDFNHPGGQFIFSVIKGREVGRYFYGGYPVPKVKLDPHSHSMFAINYIESRYIGDYRNEQCPILYHDESILQKHDRYIWKLVDSKKLSSLSALFTFQSTQFKVREQLTGVQWFGRYFYIKPYAAGIDLNERPYTVVQCLSSANIAYRKQLIEYFQALMIDGSGNVQDPVHPQLLSDNISFLIKYYHHSNNMSRFIHRTTHKRYEITGPYGFGLELNNDSTGIHYVFCNGTGVLPFLDLLDYLLKKALYTVLLDRCGYKVANKLRDDDYDNTLHNFKLVLIGSFHSPDQFHGYALAMDLLYVCQTFDQPLFDMQIRFTSHSQQQPFEIHDRFTPTTLQQILKYQPTKVYVCGSPQFEVDVVDNLVAIGVNRRIIIQI